VKTSTQEARTPGGHLRFPVSLATFGGNQSWGGVIKTIDPATIDYLFVLTGLGRRWLIPSTALKGKRTIQLGGPKYAANEIEPRTQIHEIIFGSSPALNLPGDGGVSKRSKDGGCKPSGLCPSQVRLLPPPLASSQPVKPINYERKPGQRGKAVINQKRHHDPPATFLRGRICKWRQVRVRADGPGRMLIEQNELPTWARQVGAEEAA
jgi:hypothetical protein